ncbi:flippase [Methanothermococcus sp. SCGC AD-155-E23]|nr:flippase [Methanothermococcus sp. SCGC AD-155-E23]
MIKILLKLRGDHLLRDSIYMVISNIYSKGMAYLFYFLTALILGTESFGILRGIMPLIDTVVILFSSGIPPSMARYISQYSGEDYSWIFFIFFVMIVLSTLGALSLFLLRYILGGGYESIDTSLYLVAGFTVISSSFISWGRGVLQGLLKIKDLSKTWIVEYLFKIPLAVVLSLYLGVLGALLSLPLSYIFGGLFGFHLLRRYIDVGRLEVIKTLLEKRDLIKEVILYSIPIALGTASYRLLNDLDSVVIMSLLGPQDNGIYGYASLLSRGVFLFASAVGIPLLPRVARSRDFNSIKKALLINLALITPVILLMFLFPGEMLRIFFGVEDERAAISLKILSVSAGFMSSYTVCASALQGLGHGKIPLYILLVGIVLNGILNYLLVKKIGVVGGAYGTLISSILIFILVLTYLKKCGGGDLNP